ncbi:uncharacterized protein LOC123299901 isoform X2 [Chrysoperla carnea]|uniref:uncharacterized protein LOC123299901 isoform X2 n=1 Tax=Chrysoperla carnea TaxID=189513 RepID=UPI001D08D5E1|nr:uncharacterized protein LOC123299901 isoform X2 [Chrysoperla carnea]
MIYLILYFILRGIPNILCMQRNLSVAEQDELLQEMMEYIIGTNTIECPPASGMHGTEEVSVRVTEEPCQCGVAGCNGAHPDNGIKGLTNSEN